MGKYVGALYIGLQIPSQVKRCVHKMPRWRAYIPTFSTPVPFPPSLIFPSIRLSTSLSLSSSSIPIFPLTSTLIDSPSPPPPRVLLSLSLVFSRVSSSLSLSLHPPPLPTSLLSSRPFVLSLVDILFLFSPSTGAWVVALSLYQNLTSTTTVHTPSIPRDPQPTPANETHLLYPQYNPPTSATNLTIDSTSIPPRPAATALRTPAVCDDRYLAPSTSHSYQNLRARLSLFSNPPYLGAEPLLQSCL